MVTLHTFVVLWAATVTVAQRRYYNLHDMPVTSFDCRDKILGGYYADPEANCQMFHVCVKIPGQGVQDFRFLCPNETVFDQEQQICADSGEIDCAAAGLYLDNFDLYRLDSIQAKRPISPSSKGTPIPLGPSTKSPILTNQVQEDDDYYLQRSETGDRRLHSKDLLRGSSSSNLFNNRNRGKDLEDDDADDDAPRNPNEAPQSYRPKSSHQTRGKSQYNTQFRNTAPPSSTTTFSTTTISPRIEDKKRTKVAVRKLARKRPTTPEEVKSTPASFTTQVTQRFNFGEPDQRYSTINRSPATASPFPQQPSSRQYQQNFRNKAQPSTAANFQPSYQQQNSPSTVSFQQPISQTTPAYQPNYQQQNAQTTPAYQPNYQQQNVKSTPAFQPNYQQRNEQPSTPAFFEPSGTPTPRPGGFNGRPIVAGGNYQQPSRQTASPISNSTPQQNQQFNKPAQSQNNFQNQQFNRPQQNNFQNQPQNFQNQQFNRPQQQPINRPPQNQPQQSNTQNQQFTNPPQQSQSQPQNQQFNRQPQQNQPNTQPQNQQFNRSPQQNQQNTLPQQQLNRPQQPPQNNAQNQQQFSRPQPNFQNQQNQQYQNRQTVNYNRVSSSTPAFQPSPSTISPNLNAQTINAALSPRPTPTNVHRQQIDDFDDGDQQEFLKTAHSSNFRPSDINSFNKNYKSDGDKTEPTKVVSTTKYYTPTIVTTPKPVTVSSTSQPKPPSPPVNNSPSSDKEKDTSYDYAYYDDAGAFSEYDALDVLGETDFSRTSKRAKSRLI